MNLTRIQYATLRSYSSLHTNGWSLLQVLRTYWWSWLLLWGMGLARGWLASHLLSSWAGGLVVGLAAGAFFRDIGRLQVSVRVWPIIVDITDWPKVSDLIAAHQDVSA